MRHSHIGRCLFTVRISRHSPGSRTGYFARRQVRILPYAGKDFHFREIVI